MREIASLFVETCPQHLRDIRAALSLGDRQALGRAAHSLKGAVANFHAPGALAATTRLEQLGQTGELAAADDVVARLEAELEPLLFALVALNRKDECPVS